MSTGVSGGLTEGSPRFSTITPLVRYELQRFSARRQEDRQHGQREEVQEHCPHLAQHPLTLQPKGMEHGGAQCAPTPPSGEGRASPACHGCAETPGLGTGLAAQGGSQSRSTLPLASSLRDTAAADMGLQ